ncbi:MAG: hypothetical protein DRI61_00410 [Chloroflexi bacterium]|nr:MAG: hypothetical protein DRI61_00410 [Chloroflexota bacterium]
MKIRALALISGTIFLAFLLAPPWNLLDKADFVAAGVCHRLPEHSLFLGGRQSPLCARCTGTYVGLALSLMFLAIHRRLRAGMFPPPLLLVTLLGFTSLWGIDGLNSFFSFFLGRRTLYQPSNSIRLLAGGLNGISWGMLITPFFNQIAWQEPEPKRSIESWGELATLFPPLAGALYLLYQGWGLLIYPLALLSLAGPLMLLGTINTMMVTVGLNLNPRASSWREIVPIYVIGLGGAALEILLLNGARRLLGF